MTLPLRVALPEKRWVVRIAVVVIFLVGVLFYLSAEISSFSSLSFRCSDRGQGVGGAGAGAGAGFGEGWMPAEVASALLHYATTTVIPQQNRGEIDMSVKVLEARNPSNFLVFGLGHDSSLWNALNFKGKTVFLEEDGNWVREIVKKHPLLKEKAYHVKYPTMLSQADDLRRYYRSDASCAATKPLRGSPCKLALADLPRHIYETEWDVIMIDAPRGYFDAAPGRMTAIFSAAVMANSRKKEGDTDIFLHDIDRRVEKMYAHEFLCKGNLVGSSGRLWHFRIGPFPTLNGTVSATTAFCR